MAKKKTVKSKKRQESKRTQSRNKQTENQYITVEKYPFNFDNHEQIEICITDYFNNRTYGESLSGSSWGSSSSSSSNPQESLFKIFFESLIRELPPMKTDILKWQNWLKKRGCNDTQLQVLTFKDAFDLTMHFWEQDERGIKSAINYILSKPENIDGEAEKPIRIEAAIKGLNIGHSTVKQAAKSGIIRSERQGTKDNSPYLVYKSEVDEKWGCHGQK